ncbi:hypothetical protein AAMO2058_001727900 [Amorphochlora amoebiformis]
MATFPAGHPGDPLIGLLTPGNVASLSQELTKNGWCFVELQNDAVMLVQVFKKGSKFLKKPLALKRQVPLAAKSLFDSVCNSEPRDLTPWGSQSNGSRGNVRDSSIPEEEVEDLKELRAQLERKMCTEAKQLGFEEKRKEDKARITEILPETNGRSIDPIDDQNEEMPVEAKSKKSWSGPLTTKQQIIHTLQEGLPTVRSVLNPSYDINGQPSPAVSHARRTLTLSLRQWFQSPTNEDRYGLAMKELCNASAATIVRALKPVEECFRWRYSPSQKSPNHGSLELQFHRGIDLETWRYFWNAVFRS